MNVTASTLFLRNLANCIYVILSTKKKPGYPDFGLDNSVI